MRALLSVTDKTGLIPFATSLHQSRFMLISTGGTCNAIRDADIPCTPVSDITEFPEMLNGRVRTLHPKIFGGILANFMDVGHAGECNANGIKPIDIVVVNLYDFASRPSIEEIDIGGNSLIRA